jgi:hypothetical protein
MVTQNLRFTIKNKDEHIVDFIKSFNEFLNQLNYDSNRITLSVSNENVNINKGLNLSDTQIKKDMFLELFKNQDISTIILNVKVYSHSYSPKE